jgi:DNA-binding PadR family transcriptional regulator
LLADSYNDYFETRRKELNDSPLKKFYEFNEAGQVQYKEGGLYQLASLFELDDTGKARYTPQQQYDILDSMELDEYMLRDSSGLKIQWDSESDPTKEQFYRDSV